MTNGAKKISIYAGVGILAAILIISSVGFSGLTFPNLRFPDFFSPPPTPPTMGTLIIKVSDKPANLTELWLTIDKVSAHRQGEGNETWIDLTFINNVSNATFDLLKLHNVTMDLSITQIPSGNYTQIRMHVAAANATEVGGDSYDLTVPGNGELKIVNLHITIEAGEETALLIDIVPDHIHISQSHKFAPTLKARILN